MPRKKRSKRRLKSASSQTISKRKKKPTRSPSAKRKPLVINFDPGHFIGLGIGFGIALGFVIGGMFNNLWLGIPLGILVGVSVGWGFEKHLDN